MDKKSKDNKPPRDYRAEYARRVERGIAKGLSRSQARGHPKAKEKNIRRPRPISDAALQISLQELRAGKTLTEAARLIHVSPERLRNQAKAQGAIRRKGRRWVVPNSLPRRMLIYTGGEAIPIILGKMTQASKVGRYMAAVSRLLNNNDLDSFKPFIGKSVTDIDGKKYVFETNPNFLYRISASGTESFKDVYKLII
jgi:hypothetical protein